MEPIINPIIFWLAAVCDTTSKIFIFTLVVCVFALFVLGLAHFLSDDYTVVKNTGHWVKRFAIITAIALPLTILTPSKDTIYLMTASSIVTEDNIEAFKETIERGITFTVDAIGNLNPNKGE